MNIKLIVIALIDRLAAYAAREAESEDPEETKRQEEAAARRLAEKVRLARERANEPRVEQPQQDGADAWGDSVASTEKEVAVASPESEKANGLSEESKEGKGKEKEGAPARKFRGVPENVQLFEVFWKQVVELIKVRVFSMAGWRWADLRTGKTRFVHTGHHRAARLPHKPIA